MYSMQANMAEVLSDFRIEGAAMRYSQFVPRLYNLCLSLGFKPGRDHALAGLLLFPLTKFVPWAAYIQAPDGNGYTLEQAELDRRLREQSPENPPADRSGGSHSGHARGAGG